ncbi:hypothetical protein D3C81_1544300 [compost metagenome]
MILFHQRIHIRRGCHLSIYRSELVLDLDKVFPDIFKNGHFFRFVHLRELTDVPDSTIRVDLQLALEQMSFLVHQHLDQCTFPAAARADKGAVLAFFKREGNVLIEFFLREREG